MKKRIIFLFILMFIGIMNTKAISLKRDYYDDIYFVQNGLPDYYMSDKQFHLSFNGVNAFCLDPKLKILSYDYNESNLDNLNFTNEQKLYLRKLIYYGYDYPGHQTPKYYMATQALIWEYLSDFTVQFFTEQYGYGNQILVGTERNEILSLVNNHDNLPAIANKEETYKEATTLNYTDSLLQNYELIESNYNDVSLSGNILTIKNLNSFTGTINLKFRRKSYRTDSTKVYFSSGSQTMMSGGLLDPQIFNFTINITGYTLKINKLDYDSNKKLKNSNVIITLQNESTKEYVKVNGSTDIKVPDDGTLILNVPKGVYFLKEKSTSLGYRINTMDYHIFVSNDFELNLYNSKDKGVVTINKYLEKYDEDKQKFYTNREGSIKFNLYAADDIVTKDEVVHHRKDDYIGTCTTTNGICYITDLTFGKYYVKEEVPSGFIDENIKYYFDLFDNKYPILNITNYVRKANLIINKKDIDSNKLIKNSYVIINVLNKDTNKYILVNGKKDIYISNEGQVILNDLPLGNYEIKEVSTNREYKLNSNVLNINLVEDVEVNLYNEKQKGSIEITKYLEEYNFENSSYDYELGDNIKFNLYAADDIVTKDEVVHYMKDELISNCSTNHGVCKFDNLILGKYYVKEEVPLGFIGDNKIYTFNLKNIINQSISIKNNLKKFNLTINKKDIDSDKLIKNADVYINILNIDSGNYVFVDGSKDIYISNEGQVILNDLPFGNYEIKEVSTNEEYKLNSNVLNINLVEDVEVDLYNEKQKGSIEITKYLEKYDYENSSYDYELGDNIKFSLYASDDIVTKDEVVHYMKDELVNTCITNNGVCKFDNLILGKYYVKEEVPLDFIDENKEYVIDLLKEKKQNIKINNDLKKSDLVIKKIDSITKEPLENVVFEIFYNDKSLGTFKTDNSGEIIVSNLPLNEYGIREIETLDDYVLDNNIYTIDLKYDSNIQFENDRKIVIPNAGNDENNIFSYIAASIIGIIVLLCLKFVR